MMISELVSPVAQFVPLSSLSRCPVCPVAQFVPLPSLSRCLVSYVSAVAYLGLLHIPVISSIKSDILNELVRLKVLPYCVGGNSPRSVLIMDNTSIHCSEELRIMCQDAYGLLVHLPP